MPAKKEKKIKRVSTSSSSKVTIPNFLNPDCPLYTTEYYKACFYISNILIDYIFLRGHTYLELNQLEEAMNKITEEGEYKNANLAVVDVDTNKKMVEIISKYDPDLACWHNFHLLILVTHYIIVAGHKLSSLENWESDARYHAWFFLLQYYKSCTEVEGYESNDYLDGCLSNMDENKKTFQKFVDDYAKKELWSPHVMVTPTTEGFWFNVREFLITFCQDSPEDTTVTPGVVEQSSTKDVNNIVYTPARKGAKNAKSPPISSLTLLDNAISLHQEFNTSSADADILSSNDLQHHLRKMLINQDIVNIKNLETIACRQLAVEKELKAVTKKFKKELADLAEQAEYVTQLIVSNRFNLASTLESQNQTSGNCQSIIALQNDLKIRINACTSPNIFLDGFRTRIESDGDKYKCFDYPPLYNFDKIKPISSVGTENPLSPKPEEKQSKEEVAASTAKKRKLSKTEDEGGDPDDLEGVDLVSPVHGRVTRGSCAIRKVLSKLNSTEVDSDNPDDDGISEPLSAQQVGDMISEFKAKVDAEATQVGKVKIHVGQETVQVGVEISQDGVNVPQDAVKASHVSQDGLDATHVDPDDHDPKHVDPVAKQDDAKTSQDGFNASQVGPGVSQVGKVANQDDSGDSQDAVKGSHTSQDGLEFSQVGKTVLQVDPVSPQVGVSFQDEKGTYNFDIREFQKLCEGDGDVEHIDKLYEVNMCLINPDAEAIKAYNDWYYRSKSRTSQVNLETSQVVRETKQDGSTSLQDGSKVPQDGQGDLGVPIIDLGSSKEDHEGSKGDLGSSKVDTPSSQKEQESMLPLISSFLAMCNNVETPIYLINNFMQDKDRANLVFGSTVAMAAYSEKLKQGK